MRASDSTSFWIDAVCIPQEGPLRRSTLESMGHIYANAQSTIVVLGSVTWDVIGHDLRSKAPYDEVQLDLLDRDDWIRSVWTYQELVNSPMVIFTSCGAPTGASVDAGEFLNTIGYSLTEYQKLHRLSSLGIRQRFPTLDAFQDAIADWLVAGYLDRSVLACLTGVADRYCDPFRPAKRIYALLGALTQTPSWGEADEAVATITTRAIALCNERGDFSYIYTSNSRQNDGRTWRPDPQHGLRPIVAWHSWGEKQEGSVVDGVLTLHNMVRLDLQTTISEKAGAFVGKWFAGFTGIDDLATSDIGILDGEIIQALRQIGFSGSAICHRCATGFVLTQVDVQPEKMMEAYASGCISWAFGAPGIACWEQAGGNLIRYTPIVYVGHSLFKAVKVSIAL